jgi:hypothetical protein
MAGIGRYAQHLVKVDAVAIDQITEAAVAPGNDLRAMAPLDKIEPSVFLKMGQTPVITFSTTKVGTVLTAIGIDGDDCATGFEIGYAERAQGGAFEAAAGEKITATKCFVVPSMLRAAVGDHAELSYEAHCYSSDGVAAPLGYANALPSGTPAVSELFIPGTVTVNGTPIGEVLGFTITFGIGVQMYRADGHLYASLVAMPARTPVIEIEVADMGELSAADLAGAEVTDVVCNLLKLSTAGGGLAGSGDKSVAAEKSFLEITQTRASMPGDAGLTMRATCKKGTAAILVLA